MTPEEKKQIAEQILSDSLSEPGLMILNKKQKHLVVGAMFKFANEMSSNVISDHIKQTTQPEVDGSKELRISYAYFSNSAKNVINIEPLDKFTQVSISKSELPTLISWLKKQL